MVFLYRPGSRHVSRVPGYSTWYICSFNVVNYKYKLKYPLVYFSVLLCPLVFSKKQKNKKPGDDLLSRDPSVQVPSALESLTSVFGMGTGVASPLLSPDILAI